MSDIDKKTDIAGEGNQTIGDSIINTGKVADVATKGNQTIVNVAFMDGTSRTVVIPTREDISKYKNKYVICSIDPDNTTDILEVVND